MSDLKNQLLSSQRTPFDEQFEQIKKLLVNVTQQNGKFEVLVDADRTASTLREAKFYYLGTKNSLTELKDMLINMEKMSRGVEQRNKTKKFREMYQKEADRQANVYKNILQNCTEEQKDIFKSTEQGNKKNVGIFYEKFDDQGNVKAKGYVPQEAQVNGKQVQQQNQIQLEHIDWQNQIIQQNQQDLDNIQQKSSTMNKIILDLALEVDKQDVQLDLIQDHVVTTNKNVVKAGQELNKASSHQQGSTKKILCLLVCVVVTTGIIVGSVYIFK